MCPNLGAAASGVVIRVTKCDQTIGGIVSREMCCPFHAGTGASAAAGSSTAYLTVGNRRNGMNQHPWPADGLFGRRVTRRSVLATGAKLGLAAPAALTLGLDLFGKIAPVEAITGSVPPFDFSDGFYLANGIN